jgi:hypothetical protein
MRGIREMKQVDFEVTGFAGTDRNTVVVTTKEGSTVELPVELAEHRLGLGSKLRITIED